MNQSDSLQSSAGTTGNVGSTKDELKQDASKLKDKAASQASEKTKEASQKATSAAHSTSSALREAGKTLEQDDDAPNWLGSAFKQAADSVADLADTIEGKEPREMLRDVNQFARGNPAAFLSAAALAGFAAARLLKAGVQQSDASLSDLDPASGSSGKSRQGSFQDPARSSSGSSFAGSTATGSASVTPTVPSSNVPSTHGGS